MVTLRCTQKLLRRLKAPVQSDPPPSTNILGDWYANLHYTRPDQLVLCMNERTLLVVLVTARDVGNFGARFRDAVVAHLQRIGVPRSLTEKESRAMSEVFYGPTSNRVVLGCMNDVARALSFAFDSQRAPSVMDLETKFSEWIHSPLGSHYPRDLAFDLLGVALPLPRTAPITKATNESYGVCVNCGAREASAGMIDHLRGCLSARSGHGWTAMVQMRVEAVDAPHFWMDLEVEAGAQLSRLDDFLRATWLECCGHMSAFHIGRYMYSSTGPVGPPLSASERAMTIPLSEVLPAPGTAFRYEYDFGSTTRLVLHAWGRREGTRERKGIRLLARNEARVWRCIECTEVATAVCPYCRDTGDGTFCATHARRHDCSGEGQDVFLPIVNSPRMGVCGYTRTT